MRLFLAGGAVRDLLLERPVRDVDLVVLGRAPQFVRELARQLGVTARMHERFSTATIELRGGGSIDVATARRESYDRPGALPRVEPSASIEDDLFRRDFTINAMAIEIAPGSVARLHDPFGGRRDLARRRLAVLHPLSFRDDPTRALRAARYANRLGFTLEASTRRALEEAIRQRCFDDVSGQRIRRELSLLLSEPNRPGALRQMTRLGLAQAIDPALAGQAQTLARIREAERIARSSSLDVGWLTYFLVWIGGATGEITWRLADRLAMAGTERRILVSWPNLLAKLRALGNRLTPSSLAALRLAPAQQQAALAVLSGATRRALGRAVSRQAVALAIGGHDLLQAGLEPGRQIGQALARTLAARRDGMISRREELDFALKIARKAKP
jgi:tRNA nucleotidyltransferase (CCA-adding enzyme)